MAAKTGLNSPERRQVLARNAVFLCRRINDVAVFCIFLPAFIDARLRHDALKVLFKRQFEFRLAAIILNDLGDRPGIGECDFERRLGNAFGRGFFFKGHQPIFEPFGGELWKFFIRLSKGRRACGNDGKRGSGSQEFPEFHQKPHPGCQLSVATDFGPGNHSSVRPVQ